jgi:A/G-specific adenine glycosylase
MSRLTQDATPGELGRAEQLGPALEHWFLDHGRTFPWRRWSDPYELLVAEVLLQRTRADVVATFVPGFLRAYPSWLDLSEASEEELVVALAPIGLQRRKAASLRELAVQMVISPTVPKGSEPGVGQYIERAIRVALTGERLAMVDSNFVRVLRRVFGGRWMADYRYDPRLQRLAQAVVDGASDARSLNWAVLDLGAMVCTPGTPRCGACPIREACASAGERQVA